jgi:hypothetical protein
MLSVMVFECFGETEDDGVVKFPTSAIATIVRQNFQGTFQCRRPPSVNVVLLIFKVFSS